MAAKTKTTNKTDTALSDLTAPGATPRDGALGHVTSTESKTEPVPGEHIVANDVNRELQRTNKELQVRIRELELQLAGGPPEDGVGAEYGEASDEALSTIALIKDLHGQIDAARELREALEADLASIKEKLAKEQAGREELDAHVKLLEAKAALGEQLREDLSFVEEERNEIARRVEQLTSQLAKVTEDRDRLASENAADLRRIKELESDKITLEATVLNLEETVAEMEHLRQGLAESREETQRLKENVQSLKGKLDATEAAKSSLELELATTRELNRNQNGQIEDLRETLSTTGAELAELRSKLDKSEIENANLVETNKRADRDLKTLTARFETAKKELDIIKKMLRDIRAAAMRTTTHVREPSSGT